MPKEEKIRILVCEPHKKPYTKVIDNNYKAMQAVVGGYIESTYPFEDNVIVFCNEEGKITGLDLNRGLRQDGKLYDIIAGTFFVCGDEWETGESISLTDEQIKKYSEIFKYPEIFAWVGDEIIGTPDRSVDKIEAYDREGVFTTEPPTTDKKIRFIDSNYKDLFYLTSGKEIAITDRKTGAYSTYPCKYIDSHHTKIGYNVYHICEFAEKYENNYIVEPVEPELMIYRVTLFNFDSSIPIGAYHCKALNDTQVKTYFEEMRICDKVEVNKSFEMTEEMLTERGFEVIDCTMTNEKIIEEVKADEKKFEDDFFANLSNRDSITNEEIENNLTFAVCRMTIAKALTNYADHFNLKTLYKEYGSDIVSNIAYDLYKSQTSEKADNMIDLICDAQDKIEKKSKEKSL